MVVSGIVLLALPERKAVTAGEAILQIPFRQARHAAHGLIRRLWTVAMLKEERTACLTAEAGQPAFLVLQSPEGNARYIGCTFLFLFQKEEKKIAVALRKALHRCVGGVGGEDVEFRDLYLQTKRAVAAHRRAVLVRRGGCQLQMRLHPHAVDQFFREQGLQYCFTDSLPLFREESVVVVIKQADAGGFVLCRHTESLQYKILPYRFGPEGGAQGTAVDGFIDNVPGVDDAGVPFLHKVHNVSDIAFQTGQHGFAICERGVRFASVFLCKEPARRLVVPDERVAAHTDSVFLCEFQIRNDTVKTQCGSSIAGGGIFLIFLPIQQRLRLHVVFAGEGGILLRNGMQSGWMIKGRGRNGRADRKIWPVNFLESHFQFTPVPGKRIRARACFPGRVPMLDGLIKKGAGTWPAPNDCKGHAFVLPFCCAVV